MARFNGAADKAFAIALHADDPVKASGCSSRAACLAVQLGRGRSEFQHLTSGENAPSGGRRVHQHFDHHRKRDRIRVVAIVDHGKACIVAQHAPAQSRRLKARKHSHRLRASYAPYARSGKGRERIPDVVTPGEWERQPRATRGCYEIKIADFRSAIVDVFGAELRAAGKPERHDLSWSDLGETRHARIVGVQNGYGVASR